MTAPAPRTAGGDAAVNDFISALLERLKDKGNGSGTCIYIDGYVGDGIPTKWPYISAEGLIDEISVLQRSLAAPSPICPVCGAPCILDTPWHKEYACGISETYLQDDTVSFDDNCRMSKSLVALTLARDELNRLDRHYHDSQGKHGQYAAEPDADVMGIVIGALLSLGTPMPYAAQPAGTGAKLPSLKTSPATRAYWRKTIYALFEARLMPPQLDELNAVLEDMQAMEPLAAETPTEV